MEFKYAPPKFCSSCGAQIGVAGGLKKQHPKKVTEDEDGYTNATSVPQLDHLDLDVSVEGSVMSMDYTEKGLLEVKYKKFEKRSKDL